VPALKRPDFVRRRWTAAVLTGLRHPTSSHAVAPPAATAPCRGNSAVAESSVTAGVPVVTLRSAPVFMQVLAQLSKFQASSDLRDGLKTGAFDLPLPLAQGSHSPNRILAQFQFLGQPSR